LFVINFNLHVFLTTYSFKIKSLVSKLGKPYSSCVKDTSETFSSKPFDYIVRNVKYPYSQQLCYLFCFQQLVLDKCECIVGQLGPNYKDGKICLPYHLYCVLQVIFDFSNLTTAKACTKACPLECDFIEYKISSFIGNFPTHYYKGILAKHALIRNANVSLDEIEKSVMRVNVYYETTTYTSIIE
jgi:Amiloride-sensitive sodium channel